MFINVNVHDEARPDWRTTGDVYRPKLFSFDPMPALDYQNLEHIDVVTTWKGLSVDQAEELRSWQEGFKRALESVVEEALITKFTRAGIPLDDVDGGKRCGLS